MKSRRDIFYIILEVAKTMQTCKKDFLAGNKVACG
jgi:hypothetical protein